jgi:hypothetical protein
MVDLNHFLGIHFTSAVWGTVGQWVSAVGTTLAFTATFYVIRRDAKVRRRSQARKVALYMERLPRAPEEVEGKHKTWYDLTVQNLSDEPIYDVRFHMVSGKRLIDTLGGGNVLLPGGTRAHRQGYSSIVFGGVDLLFRDNSGYHWRRNVQGHLKERGRLNRWLSKHFYGGISPFALFRQARDSVQTRRSNRRLEKQRSERRKSRDNV